jgi:hypothetical protein
MIDQFFLLFHGQFIIVLFPFPISDNKDDPEIKAAMSDSEINTTFRVEELWDV